MGRWGPIWAAIESTVLDELADSPNLCSHVESFAHDSW